MKNSHKSGDWKNRLAGMAGQVFGGRQRRADLAVRGMIFSIHDGPGIRTTVFFKGCPLHCRWCSNPESMNLHPEIVTRFETRCRHCDGCLEVCPTGAIRVIDGLNNGDGPARRLRRLDRDHYVGRTFIQPTQSMRDFGVRMKLNRVKELLAGKEIIIIEDSIIRGTTARNRIKALREIGVKKIHMRVSCPPIASPATTASTFPPGTNSSPPPCPWKK